MAQVTQLFIPTSFFSCFSSSLPQVLRKLCLYDPSDDIAVHVAMDNTLVINEVRCYHLLLPPPAPTSCSYLLLLPPGPTSCSHFLSHPPQVRETCHSPALTEGGEPTWKPLLLFISLRLGLSEINPVYIPGLKVSPDSSYF